MSLPFDEIRLKKEMSWNGSIKITLAASDTTHHEFSLRCIDKRLHSDELNHGPLNRKTSIAMSYKDIMPLIEILEGCKLPPLPTGIYGCDGELWTLTITSGFNRSQFRWWVEPPAAWKPLQDCAGLLLRWCDQNA